MDRPIDALPTPVPTDLRGLRFHIYRSSTMRLGFLISAAVVLEALWHWQLLEEMGRPALVAAAVTGFSSLLFPLALLIRLDRRVLPIALYGSVAATLGVMLWALSKVPGAFPSHAWLLIYPIIFMPLLNTPFEPWENITGAYSAFLLPCLLAWTGVVHRVPLAPVFSLAFPIVLTTAFFKFKVNGILKANNDYRCRIEELAQKDGLTGVFNRRHFTEEASRGLKGIQRAHRTASFLMIDIDHFKQVNDRFGHPAGDDVIRTLARIMETTLRETDLVGRLGGEEFAAFMPDTEPALIHGAAERLRKAIEEVAVPVAGHESPIRFTASIGISHSGPGDTLQSLLDRADKALYEAKAQGRNRVVQTQFPSHE